MTSDGANISGLSGCCGGMPGAGCHSGRRPPPVAAHRAPPGPAAAPVTDLAESEGMRWITLPATGQGRAGEVG